jgi:hypothetical protein
VIGRGRRGLPARGAPPSGRAGGRALAAEAPALAPGADRPFFSSPAQTSRCSRTTCRTLTDVSGRGRRPAGTGAPDLGLGRRCPAGRRGWSWAAFGAAGRGGGRKALGRLPEHLPHSEGGKAGPHGVSLARLVRVRLGRSSSPPFDLWVRKVRRCGPGGGDEAYGAGFSVHRVQNSPTSPQ